MRVLLTGVGCVGKTTVGQVLAVLRGCAFFDLDKEIERYFGTSIARLKNQFLTPYSFQIETVKVLSTLLERPESEEFVIALSASGLMGGYWNVVKRSKRTAVALSDTPENILARITFYDIDSKRINKQLTDKDKRLYLREIKRDISYFNKTYLRADYRIDIAGLDASGSARKVQDILVAAAAK